MDKVRPEFAQIVRESVLSPAESPLLTKTKKKRLAISVPKATRFQENRVALKPDSVKVLVNNGINVQIESNAGQLANFQDSDYSEAGAQILYDRKEIFQGDMILKVAPPSIEEIGMMKPGATLISAFQTGKQSIDYLQALTRQRITAIGYEFVEDKVGGLPLVRAMSEIAGSTVMLIAAEYLSSTGKGRGVILGGVTGVPPTKVVILGAGTVAEHAARASLGLGADIEVYDNHIYKLRRLKHAVGRQVHTGTIDNTTVERALLDADVLIGAIRAEKGRNLHVVTEEMVSKMRPGAVIIDVSIDQGGCVETSEVTNHDKPVFRKYDVVHYCVPNIASRVAQTASIAISNIFTPIIQQVADEGGVEEMIFTNKWFMKGVYMYKGSLTNFHLAKKYNLGYKDLSLLMAARF